MAEYLSPGVYVEEFDNSPRSIEGVGTSTAGFIGLAEKGATIGAPVLVTSMKNFTRIFGGALNEFEYGEYRYLAVSFMTQKMKVEFQDGADEAAVMQEVTKACKKVEPDCEVFL